VTGDARDEVTAANAAFYSAFEAGDIDVMNALWLAAPDTVCVHPGAPPVTGTPAISRAWAVIMANTPYIQFFLTDVSVGLRGDIATVTCTENVLTAASRAADDGSPDAGADMSDQSGRGETSAAFAGATAVATNVFVRTATGWRIWVHHASPVISERHDEP
jgi:ketosteroid isomerase-like protein